MRLFWSSRSPYVRKVMAVAHELGLDSRIEKLPAVVTGRSRNAAVCASSPLGQIPTLITDDGTVLYDSTVICEFLATLAPNDFFPTGAARFDALTRQALADGVLDALVRWNSERGIAENQRSTEIMAVARIKLMEAVAHIEKAGVAAQAYDIGGITLATALSYADFRFADEDWRGGHPRTAAWYAGIAARPAFVATAFVG